MARVSTPRRPAGHVLVDGRCYWRQPACKPGSVGRVGLAASARDGHSSGAALARRLEQSTRATTRRRAGPSGKAGETLSPPIRSCSRWGLPCRRRYRRRGALLPHPFTLTRHREGRAVCFLWRCPWGRPRRTLSGTVSPWSPDFPPHRNATAVGRLATLPYGLRLQMAMVSTRRLERGASNQHGLRHPPRRAEDAQVARDLRRLADRLHRIVGQLHRRPAFGLGDLADERDRVQRAVRRRGAAVEIIGQLVPQPKLMRTRPWKVR